MGDSWFLTIYNGQLFYFKAKYFLLAVCYCLILTYVVALKTKLTRLNAELEQLQDHAQVLQEKHLMALTEGEVQSRILDTARHIRRYLLYLYQVVLFIFHKSYRFPLFNPPTYNATPHSGQKFNISRLPSTLQHVLALLYIHLFNLYVF